MRVRTASRLVTIGCGLLSALLNWLALVAGTRLLEQPPLELPERITYLDLDTPDAGVLPEDLEPVPTPQPEPQPKRKQPKPRLPEPVEPALETPKPKETPEPEQPPQPEPPKEKHDFVLEQLKMVEQLDKFDEQQAPEDANYLSNINRDVREQTRAKLSNLIEDAEREQAKQLEPSTDPELGTASEARIAQQREQKSELAREAPKERPSPKDARPQQNDPKPQSLLSMRDLAPREHREAMTKQEALASEAEDGSLQRARKEQASLTQRQRQAHTDRSDPKYRFRLSGKQLDALFGKDVDAQRNILSQQMSKQKGIWSRQREHWQSPLENMVPEVRVGNQTALRSRKHPFARYIAFMHREIHDLWAWGFLDQLDARARNHPLNDYGLWSRVEIVLNEDGSIDKVRTVRFSGNTAFDSAAREIVHAAGPFPNPPREIRSGNGKIYIHWAFHRDERACGTFGATPFVLDNAGEGDRPNPNVEVRGTTSEASANNGRRLAQQLQPASGREGPVPATESSVGPAGVPGNTTSAQEPPNGAPGNSEPEPREVDPAVGRTANAWLLAIARHDIERALGVSGIPFGAGDTVLARTRQELRELLQAFTDEIREAKHAPSPVQVFTAAGLRRAYGSVPSGVQEGEGRAYGVTRVGGDTLILLLEKRFGSWRVVGISR